MNRGLMPCMVVLLLLVDLRGRVSSGRRCALARLRSRRGPPLARLRLAREQQQQNDDEHGVHLHCSPPSTHDPGRNLRRRVLPIGGGRRPAR